MQIIKCNLINTDGETLGCEKSPVKLLQKLRTMEYNEKGKPLFFNHLNFGEIHIDSHNLEEANYLILKNAKEIFGRQEKVIFIGGDHSISYPIVTAFEKIEENPLLIIFDSCADCIDGGKEQRHNMWLRAIVEEGFPGSKIILISTRSFYEGELDYIKQKGITLISMDVLQEDLQGVCDLVMERARGASGFYISIDIKSVDPAYAPGVSDIEPGGMSSRDLIYFVKRLSLLKNLRGADIVEIDSDKDLNGITLKLGAKLLAEML